MAKTMNIDKKRKTVELSKVKAAREEYELRILEKLEEIEKIKLNISVQDARISELEEEISNLE